MKEGPKGSERSEGVEGRLSRPVLSSSSNRRRPPSRLPSRPPPSRRVGPAGSSAAWQKEAVPAEPSDQSVTEKLVRQLSADCGPWFDPVGVEQLADDGDGLLFRLVAPNMAIGALIGRRLPGKVNSNRGLCLSSEKT